jgi:hypothetical protein
MINFEQVRFQVFIKDNVETQQFKAHGTLSISWLTRSIIVQQIWLYREHGFDNDVFDLKQKCLSIITLLSEPVHDSLKASFMAFVIQSVFRMLKLAVIFVYCIIGEMYEHIVDVSLVKAPALKLLRSKSHDPLMIQKYFKWIA